MYGGVWTRRTTRIPRCSTYQAAIATGSVTLQATCSTLRTGIFDRLLGFFGELHTVFLQEVRRSGETNCLDL